MSKRGLWQDNVAAIRIWRVWALMGWLDVLQRYRRSTLGQFWLTISMMLAILALGFLYAHLFKTDTRTFIPFLGIGFVLWGLISTSINDGCGAFIANGALIRQIQLPFFFHVYRLMWRNTVIFMHNAVIIIGLLLYYEISPSFTTLMFIPGLLLLLMNLIWINLVLGMISARFRDVTMIIQNIIQVSFFITPINWKPEMLAERAYLNDFNPFFHALEVVRGPLLGSFPERSFYIMSFALIIGVTVTSLFYQRYQSRLAYWL